MAAAVIIALAIFVPTVAHGPIAARAPPTRRPGRGPIAPAFRLEGSQRMLSPSRSKAGPWPAPRRRRRPMPPLRPSRGRFWRPAAGTGTPTRLGPDKSGVGAPPAAFAASAPVVSSLSPATGRQGGGNWVTVRGEDLSGASVVYFGRVPAARVSVVSGSKLRALAPPHPAGTVDVVVKGPAGRSKVSAADRYSFSP